MSAGNRGGKVPEASFEQLEQWMTSMRTCPMITGLLWEKIDSKAARKWKRGRKGSWWI